MTNGLRATIAAFALLSSASVLAQSTKRIEWRGDAASEATTATKPSGLDALKGLKTVYIPQFTVEFVEKSDGLSSKEEKRQDYVRVAYRVDGLTPAEHQAVADRLYARFVAGLQAQGLTVHGPAETTALASWSKAAKDLKPAPALIERTSGVNRLYAVGMPTYLMPRTAKGEAKSAGQETAEQVAGTGTAVAAKVGGKLGGMFGMAGGLMKMGKGLSGFGGQWTYAVAENALAKETGAAIMTVRLVVGLRDIDMAGRGFGLFRTAGSYDGKPRFVVQGDASEITITTPQGHGKGRAEVMVPQDLVFQEDVLKGRLAVDNSTGADVANIYNKVNFAAHAVGGGTAAINQTHTFAATPDATTYSAAVERNLSAISDAMLQRLAGAW